MLLKKHPPHQLFRDNRPYIILSMIFRSFSETDHRRKSRVKSADHLRQKGVGMPLTRGYKCSKELLCHQARFSPLMFALCRVKAKVFSKALYDLPTPPVISSPSLPCSFHPPHLPDPPAEPAGTSQMLLLLPGGHYLPMATISHPNTLCSPSLLYYFL